MGFLSNLKNNVVGPAITATPDEVFTFLTNEGYQSLQNSVGLNGVSGVLSNMIGNNIKDINMKSSDVTNKTINYSYKSGIDIIASVLTLKIVSANDHKASWLKFETIGGGYELPRQKFEFQIRNIVAQKFGTTPLIHIDTNNNTL